MTGLVTESFQEQLAETVGFASLKHLTTSQNSEFNEEQVLAVLLGLTRKAVFTAIWNPAVEAITFQVGAQYELDLEHINMLSQVALRKKPVVSSVGNDQVLLAVPIDASSNLDSDVILIGLETRAHDDIASAMQLAQIVVGWLRLRHQSTRLEKSKAQADHVNFYLQLLIDLVEHTTFYESTLVVSAQLQSYFRASRVSVGVSKSGNVQVLHVSGQAATAQKNRLVKLIANAMVESQHQEQILITGNIEKAPVQYAHRVLNDDIGNCGSCSIPIRHQAKTLCVILLEFQEQKAFENLDRSKLEQLANLLGPFIELIKQKNSVLNSFGRLAPSSFDRFKSKMKLPLIVGFFSALIAATFVMTDQYKVTANASLQADEQRSLIAPFDGYLNISAADSGTVASKNSELIKLETKELELERMKWESELAKLEVDKNIAASQLKRSQLPIIETKKQQAMIQLNLLSQQIEQATIRAPYDALILSSAVENRIGDRVREGEELARIAPAGTIIAALQIEDTFIREITVGAAGILYLKAYPDQPLNFSVTEIPQTASGGQGKSYFLVKATIETSMLNLSPGMEGVAQIPIRQESIAKIWSTDFINALNVYRWRLGL